MSEPEDTVRGQVPNQFPVYSIKVPPSDRAKKMTNDLLSEKENIDVGVLD